MAFGASRLSLGAGLPLAALLAVAPAHAQSSPILPEVQASREAQASPHQVEAPAPDKAAPPPADIDAPAKYRSGIVFGANVGLGALDVSGYPNSAATLDNPKFYQSSGPVLASGLRLFVMGALADQLNFGLWLGGLGGESETMRVGASGGGFRVEAFPLYGLGGRFRDLGLMAQLGVGVAAADRKDNTLSVDGTQSLLGGGAFWEITRGTIFKKIHPTVGVQLEYQLVDSPSIVSHGVLASARFAFYGGP